jgi:hypothetical protein
MFSVAYIMLKVSIQLWSFSVTIFMAKGWLPNTQHRGFFFSSWGGVRQTPLRTSAINWPVVPTPVTDEYEEFGGMRIGRGNQVLRGNLPLCPPQIPRDDLGSNPGCCSGKLVTNRLSYGIASFICNLNTHAEVIKDSIAASNTAHSSLLLFSIKCCGACIWFKLG